MFDFRMDTFITVCKYMNYTKAADALHITQPAVSQHIHYIEQDYGIKLFELNGRKIKLTSQGEQLLNVITTLKNDDKTLRRLFKQNVDTKRELTFGVTLTIGEYVIADYISSYIKKYPDTQLHMHIANTNELLHKLKDGKIDFALVEGFFTKENFDYRVLRKERYIAVCSPDNPILSKYNLSWSDILNQILITRELGSGTREILERTLNLYGYTISDFHNVIEIGNMNAIKMLLTQKCGVSFLYETVVKKELIEGTLAEISIDGLPIYHDFTFLWRKNSIFSHIYNELFQEFDFS